MQALFIELPAFARLREQYLDDEAYRQLQADLLRNPEPSLTRMRLII
ncbi:hypothetical protein [Pseudoduganella violacea]|uniref:Uncharacterized protein n=1 Tax=Pseudoduganella violacea TaxID=1715466 RepID=A0A7W5FUM7_9BURK|nr:hypothetical protein [Pseudoduganella violacea]MBB3119871.1 hypothetical protein [Pseudoduganella violacea]